MSRDGWAAELKLATRGPYLFIAEDVTRMGREFVDRDVFATIAAKFPGAWLVFDHDDERIGDVIQSWDRRYRILESFSEQRLPRLVRQRLPLHERLVSWLRSVFGLGGKRLSHVHLARVG